MPAMPPRMKNEVEPVIEPVEVEHHVQPEDTVTFKRSHFYSVLVVLAFAAGILTGYVAWGMGAAQNAQTASQANSPVIEGSLATQAPEYIRYEIPTEGAYALGPENAPIT